MSYLLDTNILSELIRPRPSREVLDWFEGVPDHSLYLSVLTLGEIRKGIENLDAYSDKKEPLRLWLEYELLDWLGDRVLPVNAGVADRWGHLLARAGRGRTPSAVDALLAATALHHGLRLVTRNLKDFRFPGLDSLELVNPFLSASPGCPPG